ncbi:MAG: glycerate kinase [Deltaproteobacteria bacterium]|nr:glycerate kinase [Deltaproteobacteria bacterium]
MSSHSDDILHQMRSDAVNIFHAALEPVNPYNAVQRFVRVEGNSLLFEKDGNLETLDLTRFEHIFLVGGGKATAPMAKAMEDLLGDRIKAGLISVKYGFTEKLSFTEIIEADHPLPDSNGVKGTQRIIDLLNKAGERDLIFSLISGGGSALLPQPAGSIRLEEKQIVTKALLKCGASIDEINAIRKHISASKGGQMARAAYPATIINLMLSDVVGDRMDVIASGPFVPDEATFQDALQILHKYGIEDIPTSVKDHLRKGIDGRIPETPKQGDKVFNKVHNLIIGSNILALEAAAKSAEGLGYKALILSSMIEGETKDVALVHVAIAKEILKSGRPVKPPGCIISGGETTVTIKGKGKGGRNQEFCLAAAKGIMGLPLRVVILSGGTDGNDGPTDAAGAVVDPLTVQRGEKRGLEISEYLANNDSYHYLEKTRDLLMTGPTNTNVMDVRIMLLKNNEQ